MSRNNRNTPERRPLWNVPYALTPFFTGRAKALNDLRAGMLRSRAVALTDARTLGSVGGTGKTQTAVAYASRFREEYRAVFWLRADSEWSLTEDLLAVATLLGLGTKPRRPWGEAIRGVFRWLARHKDWLIIVDNLEEPEKVRKWLKPMSTGHLLLASRGQHSAVLGITESVELEGLLEEEAVRFLYKRTARLDNDPVERKAAGDLAGTLGHFPLALELAGAFLTAKGLGFRDYLNRLIDLPAGERSPHASAETYGNALKSTYGINLAEAEDESPPAAELLRACAFCALERIPIEFLIKAGHELGPTLTSILGRAREFPGLFAELLEPLARYGLVRQDQDGRHFGVHPLIQGLVKADLDQATQRLWADRIIRALPSALPPSHEDAAQASNEVLWQAHLAVPLVEEGLTATLDLGHLLNRWGRTVQAQVGFLQAERLFTGSLTVFEQVLGSKDPQVAESRHHLASQYADVSRYAEAEKLYIRALAIWEEMYGRDDPPVAASIHGLACVYADQGRDDEAESLLKRASASGLKTLSGDDPGLVTYLNSLGRFYHTRKQYDRAESRYQQALAIGNTTAHPDLPAVLNNLAAVYHDKRKYAQAEPLQRRSLALAKKTRVPDHPELAICLNNLAALWFAQRQYADAEPLYQQALAIREAHLPSDHPNLLTAVENYALLLRKLKRVGEAEALEARARSIRAQHGMTAQANTHGRAPRDHERTDGLLGTLKRAWSGIRGA